ncbi:MAG: hypothetical protein ABIO68_02245 [Sphingomicrobium sp.]
MTKLTFAIAGAAALTLSVAGCTSNTDNTLNTAAVDQADSDMNAMADDAAADAANAEAVALGTQQDQLEQENAAAVNAAANPTDADEQNVAGM